MKVSLAGPSYTSASVVAAAQQTLNLIPEPIEVPDEPSRVVLYGRPGLKFFKNLSPIKIRCLWAGGGRLFVVHGNKYTEVHEDGSSTTSSKTVAELGSDPDPAQIFSNGHQLMIVSGHKVYCDNGAGPDPVLFLVQGTGHTVSGLNRLIRDTGPNFTNAWNGFPITVNGRQYTITGVIDANNMLLNPTPPDEVDVPWAVPGGDQVDGVTGGFLDGYFLVNRVPNPPPPGITPPPDPGRMFNISELNDGTLWSELQFGVKEGRADYIRSILCDHEELYLFGTESTEIWSNVGATAENLFPFQRIPGAFIQIGSGATYGPTSAGPSACWIGGGADGEPIAFQAQGLQPVRVSTHAVENAWRSARMNVTDAVSYSYIENGHTFWVINFWQNQQTWVYDLTTGLWHERSGWDPVTHQFPRYKAWYHVFLPEWDEGNGKHIVGDPVTGNLYEMSQDLFSDAGDKIIYLRALAHIRNENEFAYHHRLEALFQMGVLPDGATPPNVSLDWSDDHGHTFVTPARSVAMAAADDFTKRAAFRRLGKSRDRVYRWGIEADNCKICMIDAYLEMTQGFA